MTGPRRLISPEDAPAPRPADQVVGTPLFDRPPAPWSTDDVPAPRARLSDPPASHEAAARAFPDAKKQEAFIVGALRGMGVRGGTAKQIAAVLGAGWTDVIVSRRISGLRQAGYLVSFTGKPEVGHRSPAYTVDGCHVHVAPEHATAAAVLFRADLERQGRAA